MQKAISKRRGRIHDVEKTKTNFCIRVLFMTLFKAGNSSECVGCISKKIGNAMISTYETKQKIIPTKNPKF